MIKSDTNIQDLSDRSSYINTLSIFAYCDRLNCWNVDKSPLKEPQNIIYSYRTKVKVIVSSKKPPNPKIDLVYDVNKLTTYHAGQRETRRPLYQPGFFKSFDYSTLYFFFSGIELIELLFTSYMVSFCVETSEKHGAENKVRL